MTKNEALKMLEEAPRGDSPSKINPSMTKTQAVNVMINGIKALDGDILPDIFEKRVYQVCLNQKRPRY